MLITLIGAGNVATHLGQALKGHGHTIGQVYSRTYEAAQQLADILEAEAVANPGSINDGADVYLCALKDDVLESVLNGLTLLDPLVVHTSGSLPLSVLSTCSTRFGVLYPLQTFSKTKVVDLSKVPFFIEASDNRTFTLLTDLASQLSRIVQPLDSDDRAELHVAAVFACNFVNHLYGLADDIMQRRNLPFEHLLPLIDETASKVHELKPAEAQTGPAVRYDTSIISKHLDRLAIDPGQAAVYRCLTDSIFTRIKHT